MRQSTTEVGLQVQQFQASRLSGKMRIDDAYSFLGAGGVRESFQQCGCTRNLVQVSNAHATGLGLQHACWVASKAMCGDVNSCLC